MGIYNQDIIDRKGEYNLERMYIYNGYKTIDFNDESFDNVAINYILLHYLIKCQEKGIHYVSSHNYLLQYYEDFFKHPWKYANSPLIKRQVIEKIYGNDAKNVIDFCIKYFNAKTAQNIYETSKKRELTISEKNQLYSYLIRNLNTNSDVLKEVIKNEIKKIINSKKNIEDFSYAELQFYCQYVANTAPTKPTVILGESKIFGGEEKSNLVTINKIYPNFSIEMLTKAILHECRHSLQRKKALEAEIDISYEYIQFYLFEKYLNTGKYKCYEENYKFSPIELDAEKNGCFQARVFLSLFGRKDLSEKLRVMSKKDIYQRDYYAFMKDEKGTTCSVDYFIVKNMDDIIKAHPEEIKKYPILKHFYYSDGIKKSFLTILKKRVNEIYTRETYEHYIDYGIKQGELEKIDLTKFDKETISKIIPPLISIYRHNKVCSIIDYLKDTDPFYRSKNREETRKHIVLSTNYELVLATKMLSFVEKNFDILYPLSDSLYDFIYDFRYFDKSEIKNPILKQNKSFNMKLELYLEKYNSVSKKINREYLLKYLKQLSEKERKKEIRINGISMTLEAYMFKYILPNMNHCNKIVIGNNEISIRNIINQLLSGEKQQELNSMLNDLNNDIMDKKTVVSK